MTQFYELTTAGNFPVGLQDMKSYLKIDHSVDDEFITELIAAAVTYGEKYTGRDFRANTWTVTFDEFETRLCLRKAKVGTVTSIQYDVAGTPVTVASSVYYLKSNQQNSEVLLKADQQWPSDGDFDTDGLEGTVVLTFATVPPVHGIEQLKVAVKSHVAAMYQSRGDCDLNSPTLSKRAQFLYDQMRIARV